jgi:hypothetical protein
MTAKWSLRRRVVTGLLLADLGAGAMFAALAANSAQAAEDTAASPTVAPSETPTPAPAAASVSRMPRVRPDGSMQIAWLDAARDNTDPNYSLFQNLDVTVSQVQDLSYQAVTVSWTGGVETSADELARNYLQIMQCWGDGSDHADPTHCEWGAPDASFVNSLGEKTTGRALGTLGEDPLQDYTGQFDVPPPLGQTAHSYLVPFRTAPSSNYPNGQRTNDVTQFFDATSTNEIPGARTSADGTGEATFEIQTAMEAPHLGCGATQSDGSIRNCWLVVVPRGETSVDGSSFRNGPYGRLVGSPLSASAWKDRIEFPIAFRSVESGCKIGAAEQRTTGNEMVVTAFSEWQSSMCARHKVFGFSMIGDSESRRNIVSDTDGAARLSFIDNPLSATDAGTDTLTYAPVVKSALTIAFNINYFIKGTSPLKYKNGQQVTDLTLNARLVAKLLTQSYQDDVPNGAHQSYLSANPANLRHDPEFLALNPEFEDFVDSAAPSGLIVSIGNEDVIAQLWKWIKSDADARAFLGGTADPWGMVINRNYLALDINADATIDSFPKTDLATYREGDYVPEPGYGTFELRPYAGDFHDAAIKAFRGDAGSKTYWDQLKTPPSFTSRGAQLLGRRFQLAITDLVTAKRLGLSTAKLVNASGEAVGATNASINAAVAQFADSEISGVKVSTPAITDPAAYPLSTLTYAAVDVCRASISELKSYSTMLKYIIGDGQSVGTNAGQIPPGYVALDDTQIAAAKKSIAVLTSEVKAPLCASHSGTGAVDTATTVTIPTDTTTTTTTTTNVDTVMAAASYPHDPASALKYSLLSAMCFGVPMIAGGRVLTRKAKTL